jgi:hypothetical protein
VLSILELDFPHRLQGAEFGGSAAGSAQQNQVCEQWGFTGPISYKGFRDYSSLALLMAWLRKTKPVSSGSFEA